MVTHIRVLSLPASPTPGVAYYLQDPADPAKATIWVTGADGELRQAGGGSGGAVAWDDVTGKPATFPPSAHNQAWSTITGTPTTLAGYGITDAATAAQGSLAGTALQPGAQIPWTDVTGKPSFATVATSGAYADLSGRPTLGTAAAAATTDFATAAQGLLAASASQPGHTHTIANVTGLQTALDGKLAANAEAATVATINGRIAAGSNVTITGEGTAASPYSIAAAGGGGSPDPLDLTTSNPTLPSADTVRVFRRPIANRQLPGFVGPAGLDSALQPLLARNKVGIWMPPGNGANLPGIFGINAMGVTGFTATTRNVATTNLFTRMRRLGYVSAATAAAVGQFRAPSAQFTIGNGAGLGGFFLVVRFGISDAVLVSGARMFMGVQANAAPTNVEPSTLVNCIGIGHGAADTNMRLYFGGSAAQTPIDLGANFPTNTTSVDMYELALFAPPSSSVVHYEVTRLNTNHVATGTLSGTPGTQLPATTTLLAAPWGYRTNNATAAAVAIDVVSVYIETDY